ALPEGGVEVDDVHPLRAPLREAGEHPEGIRVVERLPLRLSLLEPHAAPAAEVDRREEGHPPHPRLSHRPPRCGRSPSRRRPGARSPPPGPAPRSASGRPARTPPSPPPGPGPR